MPVYSVYRADDMRKIGREMEFDLIQNPHDRLNLNSS